MEINAHKMRAYFWCHMHYKWHRGLNKVMMQLVADYNWFSERFWLCKLGFPLQNITKSSFGESFIKRIDIVDKNKERRANARNETLTKKRSKRSSDEGLTLEKSAFQIFHGGNFTFINSFDKTKFLFRFICRHDRDGKRLYKGNP